MGYLRWHEQLQDKVPFIGPVKDIKLEDLIEMLSFMKYKTLFDAMAVKRCVQVADPILNYLLNKPLDYGNDVAAYKLMSDDNPLLDLEIGELIDYLDGLEFEGEVRPDLIN